MNYIACQPPKPASAPVVEKHFFRCSNCLVAFAADYSSGVWNWRIPRDLKCACGGSVWHLGKVKRFRVVNTEERCACDERCTHALGPNCECQCGGENHGTGRTYKVEIDQGGIPRVSNEPDIAKRDEFFAALDAAEKRIERKFGVEKVEDFIHRRWIPVGWRDIHDAFEEISRAKGSRVHKTRLKILASICA